MLVQIISLLIILQLAGAQDTLNCCDSIENRTYTESFYNDALQKNISQQLELLQTENEMLSQKLDLVNLSIQQQLIEQKNAFKANFDELLKLAKTKQQPVITEVSQSQNFERETLPANCAEALKISGRKNGVHKIEIPNSKSKSFYVQCLTFEDVDFDKSIRSDVTNPWMIIQRRRDGSINFNRNWLDYQQGFGNLLGEFFIGLDKLHDLTQFTLHELWIQLEDFTGDDTYLKYDSFAIGSASEGYPINILGSYSGYAGDSMSSQVGQKFSTKDVDNDDEKLFNCALLYKGAWWHNSCANSNFTNLNGIYYQSNEAQNIKDRIQLEILKKLNSIKYVHMAIRPVQKT